MNILLVEDDLIQSTYFKKIVEMKYIDVRVYEAESAKESMRIIEKVDIDIFFLDIKLKGISGLELAENIRKIVKYELSPIVFISGQIGYIIDALKKVNCHDFITKPYHIDDVAKIIDKFLRHKNKVTNENYTNFKTRDGIEININKKEILFIEYYLKKCIMHTRVGKYNIKSNGLEKLITEINYKNIIRTHKSFAVNLDYLKEIRKVKPKLWEISFKNYNEKADLSYNYKDNIEGIK